MTTQRISQFDPSWFLQHPETHRYLDECAKPGLTNFLGSLQADNDVSGIKHPMIPPVSSAEESTAFLTVNGTFLPASGVETSRAWCPWVIERRCEFQDWDIHSTLCMPPEFPGALQRITLTNRSEIPLDLDLELRLSGRCVNRGIDVWNWEVPSVALTVGDLHGHSGLDPILHTAQDGILFQNRDGEAAWNAQVLQPAPDQWRSRTNAVYSRQVPPGERFELWFSLGLGENDGILETCRDLLSYPQTAFENAEKMWRDLWENVFQSGGVLSGQLPDLEVPEEVLPLAAASIFTALQLRRTHRPNQGQVRYSIATPRRVEAGFYIWDWSMASRLLACMDPEVTREQWKIALAIDHTRCQQVNNLTSKGHGWSYSFDTYNLFFMGWNLWEQSGRSEAFLNQTVEFEGASRSVLEVLSSLAHRYAQQLLPETGLADYGGKESLLECVSTYQHAVAGLNAAAAWMLERLAEIRTQQGQPEEATTCLEKADLLVENLLRHLYLPEEGCFQVLYPDGRTFPVRHALDLQTVLRCIGHRLDAETRSQILSCITGELLTPCWMRALSPHDSDAAVSGIRADHQFCGAYGAWPAQMGLGLLEIGERDRVEAWIRRMAIIARQGPIAQAYFDELTVPTPEKMPLKVTDEFPHATHWCIMGGGQFWELIERLYGGGS